MRPLKTGVDLFDLVHQLATESRLVWRVDHETTWVDRGLATASWWDEFLILPGVYPIEWTNISWSTWNPDPAVKTPGMIANTGPYYANATANVILTRSYRTNRLLCHETAEETEPNRRGERPFNTYAYEIPRYLREGRGFAGAGRIIEVER